MLTAAEVLNAKFAATKFREGYDQDEVDDFLDRVVRTLQAREGWRRLFGG
jgi:DivIVA domain-containing protein